MKPARPSLANDLRGIAQLAVDGVLGVADLAEQLHATIAAISAPLGEQRVVRTGGITGFVYRRVRDVARGVGWGVATALRPLDGVQPLGTLQREHVMAALNGVLGDRLHETRNPLAIPMQFREDGDALDVATHPAPSPRVAIFLHGLCMHDRHWARGEGSADAVLRDAGFTPLYLHYNTGRAIAQNGAELSRLLQRLTETWPVPIERLAIIGHSMGGLVARAACEQARRDESPWLAMLEDLVFLGTPHLGSGLERAGKKVDFALAVSPYTAPFMRIGGVRSEGIRDLGTGRVTEDGAHAALPKGVRAFAVAGLIDSRVMWGPGDGLVAMSSAFGEGDDAHTALRFPKQRRVSLDGVGHLALVSHPAVAAVLAKWFARAGKSA